MFTPDQVNKRSLAIKRDLDSAARSKAAKTMLDKAAAEKRARPMSEDFEPIADMITLVANDQHGEATGIVNDLLSARVLDALQDHKQTIAQTLFAPSADALAEDTEHAEQVEEGVIGAAGYLFGKVFPKTARKMVDKSAAEEAEKKRQHEADVQDLIRTAREGQERARKSSAERK